MQIKNNKYFLLGHHTHTQQKKIKQKYLFNKLNFKI